MERVNLLARILRGKANTGKCTSIRLCASQRHWRGYAADMLDGMLPPEVVRYRREVDDALCTQLQQLTTSAERFVERQDLRVDIAALAKHLYNLCREGKRLRPALMFASWIAHGGDPKGAQRRAAVEVGVALELFQAAALLHDDVIDQADNRRGLPTAHRVFAARHRTGRWSGDPAHYGEAAAVLLGNLALVAAHQALHQALSAAGQQIPATSAAATIEAFNAMAAEVQVGQFLDMTVAAQDWGADPASDDDQGRVQGQLAGFGEAKESVDDRSEEHEARAMEVLQAKSASYSVRWPLVIGAALAGATSSQLALIEHVGRPLGAAFQLRDDVLSVFGDPEQTGKPTGGDLCEGKRTVLIARAFVLANSAGRQLLSTHLGVADLTESQVQAMRETIKDCGALSGVESLISDLYDAAVTQLQEAPLDPEGRDMLMQLAEVAVNRTW